jgi:HTH-type transcriptional regulator/antitoxin MqsA
MTNPRDYPDVIQSAETGRPLRRGVKMLTINVDGQSFTYGQPGWWASFDDPEDTEGQLIDEDNTIRGAARREARAKAKHSTLSPLVIRAIREACGLSQQEAARVFGGGRKAFEKYEAGEIAPSSAMTRLLLLAARRPDLFQKGSSVPMISEADATLTREMVRKSSVDRIYARIYNSHPGKEPGQLQTSSAGKARTADVGRDRKIGKTVTHLCSRTAQIPGSKIANAKHQVIDLESLTRQFLPKAVALSRQNQQKEEAALQVIFSPTKRNNVDPLKKWLRQLYAFSGVMHYQDQLVDKILEFADEQGPNRELIWSRDIISKFHLLEQKLQQVVPKTDKGNSRDVTSLTSKSLWHCYPNGALLYDSYTQQMLWTISNLACIAPVASGEKYLEFSDIWFQVYDRLEYLLDQERLSGYPYKMRVFDRMLWIIGHPRYYNE